jgi:hypothetical protein
MKTIATYETIRREDYNDYNRFEFNQERIKGKGIIIYLNDKEYEENMIICGRRETSVLFGERIRLIPEEERKDIKSKLLSSVKKKENVSFLKQFPKFSLSEFLYKLLC